MPSQPLVLLIDDSSDFLYLLWEVLILAGYHVLEAQDGPEGVRLIGSTARTWFSST